MFSHNIIVMVRGGLLVVGTGVASVISLGS
jgi:hypothetical protein